MAAKPRSARPRPAKSGAVHASAQTEHPGGYAERLVPEIGEDFRPSAELVEAARRVAAAAETPNGRGWVRLHELLEQVADDPVVRASLGASEFLAIVTILAGDGVLDQSASPRFNELYSIMSNRGGGPKRRVDPAAVKRMAKAGMLQADIADRLRCDVRTVRRVLKESP